MPELMENAVFFGIVAAILSRFILLSRTPRRRLPLWASVLIGVAMAYVGTPVLVAVQQVWRTTPFLPDITSGMFTIGLFVIVAMQLMFEGKDQPRRVPIWLVAALAIGTAFSLPALVYQVTGTYSSLSLRDDVNQCTRGMLGEVQPRWVSNTCDFPIVVGLCMPGELNPAPCAQSVTLAPNATATFDPGEARLSFAPGNRDGLTVVACHVPNRPSRILSEVGRRHEGVCLPGL